ncbi:phospholipase D-like domain-containing protein [Halorubrum aethiopicum]|uniref:phospholipase D-like domain-containing protein n=1 Tax=Halorubrum aethiopicum TaxID=1758255 RepID=UPI001E40F604|nr:phospholipase D-like domain-containing protein [Halorubrum aethiopicum]
MGRAFSLPSSGLRYLLGHALTYGEYVVICSPWLSDVDVHLPLTEDVNERRMKLTAAIRALNTQIDVYVRPDESSNNYALSRLTDIENVNVHQISDLHAKAIVTEKYVYVGSANITRGGLLTNLELCEVLENDYGSVEAYLTEELEINPIWEN